MGVVTVYLRDGDTVNIETDEDSSIEHWRDRQIAGVFETQEGIGHLQVKGKNVDAVFHHAQWAYLIHDRGVGETSLSEAAKIAWDETVKRFENSREKKSGPPPSAV